MGTVMMMAMDGLRPTPTAVKVYVRDCGIFFVLFAVFTSVISMVMKLSMSFVSISRQFRPLLSLLLFILTRSEHVPYS
jgi:hypothetical protein